jgi:hypothetical protein
MLARCELKSDPSATGSVSSEDEEEEEEENKSAKAKEKQVDLTPVEKKERVKRRLIARVSSVAALPKGVGDKIKTSKRVSALTKRFEEDWKQPVLPKSTKRLKRWITRLQIACTL